MNATPAPDIVVAARFNGPARSGNGGYVSGLVAATLSGANAVPVTVTLRLPPPLDTPMRVSPEGTQVRVFDHDRLVAEAVYGTFSASPPDPVDPEVAEASPPCYAAAEDHPFPSCFACGIDREPGDGLRVFPGSVDG